MVDDPTLRDRDLAFTRIDLHGDGELWAFSMHLSGASSMNRTIAAEVLVAFIRAEVAERDFMVVVGDFNTRSRKETCVDTDETDAPRDELYDRVQADPGLDRIEVATAVGMEHMAVVGEFEIPAGLETLTNTNDRSILRECP